MARAKIVFSAASLITALSAATMTNVRAWRTGDDDVALSATVQGKFSSVLMGSFAQIIQAAMGGSWRIHYRAELRREAPGWPDKVVASDVYTYRMDFPLLPDERVSVTLSSSQQGGIASASVSDGEELASIVQNLGRIGGNNHVVLPYQWTSEDGGRDFHVRVRASMDVPFERDDVTEWLSSSSFTVPKDVCPAGSGETNLIEDVRGVLGMNSAPRVPECCYVSGYEVERGEVLNISFSSFDPDEGNRFRIQVHWGDGNAGVSDLMGGSAEWCTATLHHRFSLCGDMRVSARAVDEDGKASEWSAPVIIGVR
ncbi:MAG: hypothetical protein R6X13_07085 [bacterium]